MYASVYKSTPFECKWDNNNNNHNINVNDKEKKKQQQQKNEKNNPIYIQSRVSVPYNNVYSRVSISNDWRVKRTVIPHEVAGYAPPRCVIYSIFVRYRRGSSLTSESEGKRIIIIIVVVVIPVEYYYIVVRYIILLLSSVKIIMLSCRRRVFYSILMCASLHLFSPFTSIK